MKRSNLLIVSVCMLLAMVIHAQQPKSGTASNPKQKPSAEAGLSEKGKDKQEEQNSKPSLEKDKQKELAGKSELTSTQLLGLRLIRETAIDAALLEDRRSASLIQAQTADLLWDYDKPAAKDLFSSAFEAGVDYYLKSKGNNRQQVSKNSYVDRSDVLLEVIRLVNRRDPYLARTYTDRYIEIKKQLKSADTSNTTKSAQTLERLLGNNQAAASGLWNVAISFLETDYKLSAEIAERALSLALTHETTLYLYRLAERDRKMADQLYTLSLNRLQADAIPVPAQLTVIADYPFATGKVRLIDGQSNLGIRYPVKPGWAIDPQLVNQLLSTAYVVLSRVALPAATQQSDEVARLNTAFYMAKYLEPKVAEFQPALMDKWRTLTLRLTSALERETRLKLETSVEQDTLPRERQQPSTPQSSYKDTLARAEKTDNVSQRDLLYGRAALSASQEGEPGKALEIVTKIADSSLRRRLTSWIGFDAAERALKAKEWDDARSYALEVEAPDQRTYLLLRLYTALHKEKAVTRATEILEEAFRLALAAENKPGKVKALIAIANTLATTDFTRSYDVIEAAISAANQLPRDEGLAPDDTGLVRALDFGGNTGSNTQTVEEFNLSITIVKLAKHNLERSLILLQTLGNLPLRYSAKVTLAGSLLHPTGKQK